MTVEAIVVWLVMGLSGLAICMAGAHRMEKRGYSDRLFSFTVFGSFFVALTVVAFVGSA